MKKLQTKVVEKIKTHFMTNNCFSKIVPFYGIMWKNTVEPQRPQMTMWWMLRTACWIPKATNTHSYYVVLIDFPLQQWLHKHTSMLQWFYEVMQYRFVLEWSCQIWSGPHHTERLCSGGCIVLTIRNITLAKINVAVLVLKYKFYFHTVIYKV
jgi:hypothetical protein